VLKRRRPRPPSHPLDRLFWTILRATCDPAKKWLAFLHNHREAIEAIVALDLFTVPTATFRVLYCFFVIEHGRRRILHFNTTPHPSADWVVQQLRETFAQAAPYRYAILDRDSIFNPDVIAFLKATGLEPKRTSIQAPWQNGIATGGQNRRNVCTSRESLSSVSSAAMPKRRSATQRTSQCSRSPPRRPGRMTPERGNRGPSGIDASPSG
jgi:hypothetical protein